MHTLGVLQCKCLIEAICPIGMSNKLAQEQVCTLSIIHWVYLWPGGVSPKWHIFHFFAPFPLSHLHLENFAQGKVFTHYIFVQLISIQFQFGTSLHNAHGLFPGLSQLWTGPIPGPGLFPGYNRNVSKFGIQQFDFRMDDVGLMLSHVYL